MKFLRTLFASLMVGTAAKAAEPSNTKNPADMMREMRIMWLKTIPEKGSWRSLTPSAQAEREWFSFS